MCVCVCVRECVCARALPLVMCLNVCVFRCVCVRASVCVGGWWWGGGGVTTHKPSWTLYEQSVRS